MTTPTADVVICGAGIAGIAVAYHLAVRYGVTNTLLVEERAPLTLTSDKSTECYRNWWPDAAMVALMNRSIDLMEELAAASGNRFLLNRRGYLFASADPERAAALAAEAAALAQLGAGQLRRHAGQPAAAAYGAAPAHGFAGQPAGADLITDPALIQARFPYLNPQTRAALHVRRAGWFSAQQLGMELLEQARARGVRLLRRRLTGVEVADRRVQAVRVAGAGETQRIATGVFVNAAGPMLDEVGRMLGVELPVFSELHLKTACNDYLGVVPRDAPLLIWSDPVVLEWSAEERAELAADPATRRLLDSLPAGVHTRPEGGPGSTTLLLLWDYAAHPVAPRFPFAADPFAAEVALRGMAAMIPGLRAYVGKMPAPVIDGGYYTRTRENRPLIGPLPVAGAYVVGALSGFGLMAACAAGELLAAQISGATPPAYAPDFALERYADPAYQRKLAAWGDTGQL